jgi:hypothetical protein
MLKSNSHRNTNLILVVILLFIIGVVVYEKWKSVRVPVVNIVHTDSSESQPPPYIGLMEDGVLDDFDVASTTASTTATSTLGGIINNN